MFAVKLEHAHDVCALLIHHADHLSAFPPATDLRLHPVYEPGHALRLVL